MQTPISIFFQNHLTFSALGINESKNVAYGPGSRYVTIGGQVKITPNTIGLQYTKY